MPIGQPYNPAVCFQVNQLPLNANQFEQNSLIKNSDPSIVVWNTELNLLQVVSTLTNLVLQEVGSNTDSVQLIAKKIGLSLNPTSIGVISIINECRGVVAAGQIITDDDNGTTAEIVSVIFTQKFTEITISKVDGVGFEIGDTIFIRTQGGEEICKTQIRAVKTTQEPQEIPFLFNEEKYAFVIHDILLTNADAVIDKASGGVLFSDKNSRGAYVANIDFGSVFEGSAVLADAKDFINVTTGNVQLYPTSEQKIVTNQLIGNNLFFNLTKATQDATCDMYIYGVILK